MTAHHRPADLARQPARPIGRRHSIAATVATLALAAALAACAPTSSASPSPTLRPEEPPAALALGCIGVGEPECRFLAERIIAEVAGDRGAPFSLTIELYCAQEPPCPETLDARRGQATMRWADGAEPVTVSITPPAAAPRLERADSGWSGLQQPSSARVVGPGPFPLELGHCGLLWQVDFDGSFWVPVGHVDSEASGLINGERGLIRLLGPNLAAYAGTGWEVQLARFPGPLHVWGCL